MQGITGGLKKLAAAVAVVLVVALNTGIAAAADTWLPKFDANQRVHVAPDVKVNPDEVAETKAALQKASSVQNIQYYLVVTRKGDESVIKGLNFASWKLDRMIEDWQAQPGFPVDNYAVVMVVLGQKTGYKAAMTSGSTLQTYGMNGKWLEANVLTQKLGDTYLPNNPGKFTVEVATDLNTKVAALRYNTNTRPWVIKGIVLGVAVLIWSIVWFVLRRMADGRIRWLRQTTLRATELDDSLYTDHGVLLESQGKRLKDFENSKDEGAQTFREAITGTREVSKRQAALAGLLGEVEKRRSGFGAFWPLPFAYIAIIMRVNSGKVKVSVAALDDKKKSLFSDDSEEGYFTAEQLAKDFEKLYQETNTKLSTVKQDFQATTANSEAIKKEVEAATKLQVELTSRGLPTAPYEARLTALTARGDSVVAMMISQPRKAHQESDAVIAGVGDVQSDIRSAAKLFDDLPATERAVEDAATAVVSTRKKAVVFRYQPAKGETVSAPAAGVTYLLTEQNGNPDAFVAGAREQLAAARAALVAGDPLTAEIKKKEAEVSAGNAKKTIETVVAAQLAVEKALPSVRTDRDALIADVPHAKEAVASMEEGFLPGNFTGEPQKIVAASGVIDNTAARLATMRDLYFAQRFLEAETVLTAIADSISSARASLTTVHARLKELNGLRAHAKEVSGQVGALSTAVEKKLQTNSFTTSSGTDTRYKTAKPGVGSLAADVAKTKTDWVAAANTGDTLLAELRQIDGAIDTEKAAHDQAVSDVGQLEAAITAARKTVDARDTRQSARQKLSEATASVDSLKGNLKTARTDWKALSANVSTKRSLVQSAVDLAEEDHRKASAARAAIDSANTEIEGVKGRGFQQTVTIGQQEKTFGWGVSADVSRAEGNLQSARGLMTSKDYEGALSQAQSASEAAGTAASAAAKLVKDQIDSALEAYRKEQERLEQQRQQQLREQQERERAALAAQQAQQQPQQPSNNGGGDDLLSSAAVLGTILSNQSGGFNTTPTYTGSNTTSQDSGSGGSQTSEPESGYSRPEPSSPEPSSPEPVETPAPTPEPEEEGQGGTSNRTGGIGSDDFN